MVLNTEIIRIVHEDFPSEELNLARQSTREYFKLFNEAMDKVIEQAQEISRLKESLSASERFRVMDAANAIDDQISQRDGMRMQINSLEDALMVKNSEVDALKAENERLRGEMWKSIDDALPTIKDSCDGKVECFHPRFGVRYVLWQSVKNWKDYAGYTHWRVLNLPPPPKSK
jgi:hypothetical protein